MPGSYVVEASAMTQASPAQASSAILSAAGLVQWFKGAHDAVAEEGFPAVGGRMRWKVRWMGMDSDFSSTVVSNELPRRLVLAVKTPSGESLITNSFEPVGQGARYTKRVEVQGAGWVMRRLMGTFLPRSVRNEVQAAARIADNARTP
jgi:Polyketide cyclase / dehydrase and lipid transport